jgi:hypothetical protein
LRAKMEYYIKPAEQSDEVNRQLAEITPAALDPEKLTMIDPACGSGHILVEGYDLLKEIYLERGYTLRQIPRLILEKNLYGLDIDDRAAQLAGFALMMKARSDDRQILSSESTPRLNVLAIQESKGLDAEAIAAALLSKRSVELVSTNDLLPETIVQPVLSARSHLSEMQKEIKELIHLFANGKTIGSLVQISDDIAATLPAIRNILSIETTADLLEGSAHAFAAQALMPLLRQAEILAGQYDAVVANPPYMGGKAMNAQLKDYVQAIYPDSKSDLFAVFIDLNLRLAKNCGFVSMITMQSWMFLSSYEKLRQRIISEETLLSMAHLGARAFDTIGGEVVSTTAFAIKNTRLKEYNGKFLRLVDGASEAAKQAAFAQCLADDAQQATFLCSTKDFERVPTSPIAYWLSQRAREIFETSISLESISKPKQGATTSDNARFLRLWHEITKDSFETGVSGPIEGKTSQGKWFPYNKGGEFRRWYGNQDFVINYGADGRDIKAFHEVLNKTRPGGRLKNQDCYFRECVSWSKISTGLFAVRYFPAGFIFDVAGSAIFYDSHRDTVFYTGMLNTNVITYFLSALSPTMNFEAEHLCNIPIVETEPEHRRQIELTVIALIDLAKADWDAHETSWNFSRPPWLHPEHHQTALADTYATLRARWQRVTENMQQLEQDNNRLFIDAYGLANELTPVVSVNEITLTCNPSYRYGDELSNEEIEVRLRSDVMREMISYAIGCMMGRYSLARPGLIYANAKNEGFDALDYGDFPASADGILPITQDDWFSDDATNRIRDFLNVAWAPQLVAENLQFIAQSLGPKPDETPLDTVRRYLSRDFFKDHLQTYRSRPIYWLFSSGKEKAFECLVYLHRYNAGTLSRLRMEYVVPLQGRMRGKAEQLDAAIKDASSAAAQTKLRKELERLKKKQAELVKFDEELRHFADQRIELDLDDGVKVNYAKFGNLLAEVKKISGDSDE